MSEANSTASERLPAAGFCSVSLAMLGGGFCSLTRRRSGHESTTGCNGKLRSIGPNARTDKRSRSYGVSRFLLRSRKCARLRITDLQGVSKWT